MLPAAPKFGDMHNLLYINNGNKTFTESAEKYGIADTRQTMNASFFDYDKDGDLDLFLITNPADEMVTGVNTIRERMINGESAGTDILYRNNGNGTFTDVSKEAGILVEGYSLVQLSVMLTVMDGLIYMYQMIFLPMIFYISIMEMELLVIRPLNA